MRKWNIGSVNSWSLFYDSYFEFYNARHRKTKLDLSSNLEGTSSWAYTNFIAFQSPIFPEIQGKSSILETNFLWRSGKYFWDPGFRKFRGLERYFFLYRYFWNWKCRIFTWILWKLGPDREEILHRPRVGMNPRILHCKPPKNKACRSPAGSGKMM